MNLYLHQVIQIIPLQVHIMMMTLIIMIQIMIPVAVMPVKRCLEAHMWPVRIRISFIHLPADMPKGLKAEIEYTLAVARML